MMLNFSLILVGKTLSKFSKMLNLGHGSTWPGHIALEVNKNFIKDLIGKNSRLKIILIAGTNGKTTTGKLIQTILEKDKRKVFQNETGANLLNGIASSLLLHSTIFSAINYDFVIFEVDENSLPLVLNELTPDYLILLNLFRDQLDRYGEINIIADKWKKAINKLSKITTLILNADDPQIAYLGENATSKTLYFGIEKPSNLSIQGNATDSTYCPSCNSKLIFKKISFSHLGDWACSNCKFERPKIDVSKSEFYPLNGTYNQYNTHAAILLAKINNVNNVTIKQSLKSFTPAFGRQEKIIIDGKTVQIFLSKNPTGFNESLKTILEKSRSYLTLQGNTLTLKKKSSELKAKNSSTLLIVLNDRIPDGRDVSWIWDTDIESFTNNFKTIIVSGDRCYDMGLRIKYAFNKNQISNIKNQNHNSKVKIYEDLRKAIKEALNSTGLNETLYILPTYSAMLEVRKILTGKKIL